MWPSRTAGTSLPARAVGDPFRAHGLAAPRRDDDVRPSLDHGLDATMRSLAELRVAKLGKDRIAAGDLDQLLDPPDAGDQRVVPFLEVDTRARRQCARLPLESSRFRARDRRRACRLARRSRRAPPTMRIICRISATLRWLNDHHRVAALDQLGRRCSPADPRMPRIRSGSSASMRS